MASGTRYLKLDEANAHFGGDSDILLSGSVLDAMPLSADAPNPFPAIAATPVYRPPILPVVTAPAVSTLVRPDALADILTLAPEPIATPSPTPRPTQAPATPVPASDTYAAQVVVTPAPQKKMSKLMIIIMAIAGATALCLLMLMFFLPRRLGTTAAPSMPGPGGR